MSESKLSHGAGRSSVPEQRTSPGPGEVAMMPTASLSVNATPTPASRSMALPRFMRVVAGIAIVLGAPSGCIANSDPTPSAPPPPPPPKFTLSLAAVAPGITPGGTAEIDVAVNRVAGYSGAVTIGPIHIGPAEDFYSDPVTVAATDVVGKVMLQARSSTPLGTEIFYIDGTGPGAIMQTIDIPILVSKPGSFGITVENEGSSPYPHPISTGAVFTLVVDVNRNQFTQPVTLSANTNAGVTVTFSPSQVTGTQSTMSIAVASSALAGTDTIKISASSAGSPTATAIATIMIVPGSYTFAAAPPAAVIPGGLTGTSTITITRDAAFLAVGLGFNVTGTAATGITVTPTYVSTNGVAVSSTPLPISVASTVPIGPYVIQLTATPVTGAPGALPIKTTTVSIQVGPPASYSLSVQTAPLTVAAGSSATDLVNIVRTNFTGAITISAIPDTTGLTITAKPATATSGNQDTLTIVAASTALVGTHLVTLKGVTTSGLPDVTTSFAVMVTLPVGGVPAGIVIAPTTATKAVGGTQQFLAYLVDAQGIRTAPAAGWSIGIQTDNSNVAQMQSSSFDSVQLAQVATVQARGQGQTPVRAYYQDNSNGRSTFLAIATFTVTP